ncbi:hypothetical protein F5X99DRAFT_425192 [Biscogniauxia marginata]|nr:hypothetical protein F5X99DRAFT_425192 [Biscogniauxia marginata]
MEPSNIIRPVGSTAQFYTSRHSLGLCRSVINTCRYTASRSSLRHHIPVPLECAMEHALASVVMRHGILRVGIAGEDTNAAAFVHVKTIDLRRMIEWKDLAAPGVVDVDNTAAAGPSNSWDERLLRSLEECHEPLWEALAQKPGWKVVVHYDPRQIAAITTGGGGGGDDESAEAPITLDISFIYHHAYADGKSAYIFHGDLLRALNNPTTTPELQHHILHLPHAPVLAPPLEHLIPFSLSWIYLLRTILHELVAPALAPSWLRPATPSAIPWTGGVVDPAQARCHLRLVAVAPRQLAAVLQRCRDRGATLTGLLHALALASLCARLDADAPAFRGTTPVSLRPYARPGFDAENTIHCLATAHDCEYDAAVVARFRASLSSSLPLVESLIWEQAARTTADLRAKRAELPRDDVMALMGYVSDWRGFHAGKFGKPRAHSWEVSNVGSARGALAAAAAEDGQWRVERSVFTQGALPLSAAITLNVAGVEGGKGALSIAVGWQEGIVPLDLAEGVVEDLRRWIGAVGEGRPLDV